MKDVAAPGALAARITSRIRPKLAAPPANPTKRMTFPLAVGCPPGARAGRAGDGFWRINLRDQGFRQYHHSLSGERHSHRPESRRGSQHPRRANHRLALTPAAVSAPIKLSELAVGASAVVQGYPKSGTAFIRLREMGLLAGPGRNWHKATRSA